MKLSRVCGYYISVCQSYNVLEADNNVSLLGVEFEFERKVFEILRRKNGYGLLVLKSIF